MCQCKRCNGTAINQSIFPHSGIQGAADEAVLNEVLQRRGNKSKGKEIYQNMIENEHLHVCHTSIPNVPIAYFNVQLRGCKRYVLLNRFEYLFE
jgi:hypothetical protein